MKIKEMTAIFLTNWSFSVKIDPLVINCPSTGQGVEIWLNVRLG